MEVLPLKSEGYYLESFLTGAEAEAVFREVTSVFDVNDKRIVMATGEEFFTETVSYLFLDEALNNFDNFAEVWGRRSVWTALLAEVRDRVFEQTGIRFPVARCIYYKDGSEGMGFHRDLPAYGSTAQIASLSLGAERDFIIRPNDVGDSLTVRLHSGSLLFMGEGFQENYEHAVPADQSCRQPRLNITFRKYGWD